MRNTIYRVSDRTRLKEGVEVEGWWGLTAQKSGNNVADRIEEEEFGNDESLDEHGEASNDDGKEGDDVEGADYVEDDVAWTSQWFLEERHFGRGDCC